MIDEKECGEWDCTHKVVLETDSFVEEDLADILRGGLEGIVNDP